MFDRFTDRARKVMQLARQQAIWLHEDFIGVEHILLGLVDEGSGVAATVLRQAGVDLAQVRGALLKRAPVAPSPPASPGQLPFTPRAKRALERSLEEAVALAHSYIGTEHLLLGLIHDADSVAGQALVGLGLSLETLRKGVLEFLAMQGKTPPSQRASPSVHALGRRASQPTTYPARATIVEVSPRDGLQNEAHFVPTATKLELIRLLAAAGVAEIEATSFVSPKWIPQLADAAEVLAGLTPERNVKYSVLVPNLQGYERAIAAGATRLAVFTAASETFSQKNTNATIAQTLERFAPVLSAAKAAGIWTRGYVSCALGCPYEGRIDFAKVVDVAVALVFHGCDEVAISDTIGVGTPREVATLLELVTARIDPARLAVHFHDTYGQALANIHVALRLGVVRIDTSVAGLGGCPYAKGASGNVATEDVVYSLGGSGVDTGIDLDRLIAAGQFACAALGRPNGSRVGVARSARLKT